MKVPVDPLLPRPRFQLSLQRRDESQLIIALITSVARIPLIGIGDACLEILVPRPRGFRIDTALRARVITVRSTSSACNSRPSFPAFLLVALAKLGNTAEDVHAWNSFLIGGNRRVKTFLSFPIDRSTQHGMGSNSNSCRMETLLSNTRRTIAFNFSPWINRGKGVEIGEGEGAYKYWPEKLINVGWKDSLGGIRWGRSAFSAF